MFEFFVCFLVAGSGDTHCRNIEAATYQQATVEVQTIEPNTIFIYDAQESQEIKGFIEADNQEQQ